ncbi:DNA-binding protein [Lysinibacillus fusiformis]|uniref:DNA-binding protein n=1 Tax=Lysinibacillus fusiformis TaxID=28031 RepID=UPI00215A2BCC|nr:DNA-binding protein [Lysinibacillus fusiformis]MCR8853495.1 DNA-binding protein [Lysinibacillus fusiformis]
MEIKFDMPGGLGEQLKAMVLAATKEALEMSQKQLTAKEWMSLKEGATYAGVSYNSFTKFREMGLKVCEIDGIKRVSKKEIDLFLQNNSY